jgi:putative sterol carrier protein
LAQLFGKHNPPDLWRHAGDESAEWSVKIRSSLMQATPSKTSSTTECSIVMERFASFRPLIRTSRDDLRESFQQMGQALAEAKQQTRIHFRLLDADKREAWTLDIGPGKTTVRDKHIGKPKIEIIIRTEAWTEIAQGKLSPIEAFLKGRLRVRGDISMAKRLLRHLCEPDGVIDIC